MVEVEIMSMREFSRFVRPGFVKTVVRVTYRTETGYVGILDIPKAVFDPDKVIEEVKKAIKPGHELIGTKIKV